MKTFIISWADIYNDEKYPRDFYFESLKRIHGAETPRQLADGIVGMLHWKDGKVRKVSGNYYLNDQQYSLSKPKPNTYSSDRHYEILSSTEFFTWVKNEVVKKPFNINYVKEISGGIFNLWKGNSLVLPTFLLHVVAPDKYPLYDQHVERAKRVITCKIDMLHSGIKLHDYIGYQEFFDNIVEDVFGSKDADLEKRKQLDEGLWAFGKWLKRYLKPGLEADVMQNATSSKKVETLNEYVPDSEFKRRVLSHINNGLSQLKAMKKASEEFGITLKDSYYQYPGSHIYRWRKQGF